MALQHSSFQIFFSLAQFPLWAAPLAWLAQDLAGNAAGQERHKGWDLGNLIFVPLRKQIWQRFRPDFQPRMGGKKKYRFLCHCSILHCSRGSTSSSLNFLSKKNSHICWGLPASSQGDPRAHTLKKKSFFQHSSKDQQDTEQFLPTAKPGDKSQPPAGVETATLGN